jgi:hypothetical protein
VGDDLLTVIEVEDRWYGPGYAYFRVFADDARRYILREDIDTDERFVEETR